MRLVQRLMTVGIVIAGSAMLGLGTTTAAWSQYSISVGDIAVDTGQTFQLPVEAEWGAPVMGYTLSIQFDVLPPIDTLEFGIANTLVAELGPEFVQAEVNIFTGQATLGVLFEALPPFDTTLEVIGFPIALAYFTGSIDAETEQPSVTFTPMNGLGNPPKNNSFVVNNQSIAPDTLNPGAITIVQPIIEPNYLFIRGDVDLNGILTISDVLYLLMFTFQGGPAPLCHDAADANDSGHADITDGIFILNFLFLHGATPWPPYPSPGVDFTPDNIGCDFSPFEG